MTAKAHAMRPAPASAPRKPWVAPKLRTLHATNAQLGPTPRQPEGLGTGS